MNADLQDMAVIAILLSWNQQQSSLFLPCAPLLLVGCLVVVGDRQKIVAEAGEHRTAFRDIHETAAAGMSMQVAAQPARRRRIGVLVRIHGAIR